MPKEGQKNLTIPEWVWDMVNEYYERHKEDLKFDGINSTTGLITRLILQAYRDAQASKEENGQ